MRGIYTAAYLDELLRKFADYRELGIGLDIGKAFDLIVGTSSGAIIAAALAAAVPPAEIVKLYREEGPRIFPVKLPQGLGWQLIKQLFTRRKHLAAGDAALAKALQDVFGSMTIGDLHARRRIGLAIPAVEMSRHHAWIFKTPHLPNSIGRDNQYRISDICRASSAAPIYRSLAVIDDPGGFGYRVFADGGLFANTPVMVGLVDALKMAGDDQRIEIYGLGNCKRPDGQAFAKDAVHLGLVEWRFGGRAASLAIDAQEEVAWNTARLLCNHLNRQVRLIRFPRGVVAADTLPYLDLDETSDAASEALIMQAQADVTDTLSACADENNEDGQLLKALLMDIPPCSAERTESEELR